MAQDTAIGDALMRLISGAVKMAADAHPDQITITGSGRSSIAKRATCAVLADWDRLSVLRTAPQPGVADAGGEDGGSASA